MFLWDYLLLGLRGNEVTKGADILSAEYIQNESGVCSIKCFKVKLDRYPVTPLPRYP